MNIKNKYTDSRASDPKVIAHISGWGNGTFRFAHFRQAQNRFEELCRLPKYAAEEKARQETRRKNSERLRQYQDSGRTGLKFFPRQKNAVRERRSRHIMNKYDWTLPDGRAPDHNVAEDIKAKLDLCMFAFRDDGTLWKLSFPDAEWKQVAWIDTDFLWARLIQEFPDEAQRNLVMLQLARQIRGGNRYPAERFITALIAGKK
jgi:hypothetical protein